MKARISQQRLDDDAPGPRLSGYLVRPEDKDWWKRQLRRVAKLDGLPGKVGVGYLLSQVAKYDLKLDRRSLDATTQNGHEPTELTHKPVKRARAVADRATAARG